jgi:hypothetical protein
MKFESGFFFTLVLLKPVFCPLFTQDLFFKYTWNNFLHLQVELCIAAILSHAAREEQAEASGSDGKVEPLQGSGDGNGKLETTPSITSPPENTMVTHVSPGHVGPCHLQPALPRLQRVSS